MEKYEELAELIFPNITETIADLEKKYPKRTIKDGAEVTRFAPSPTGFLHSGAVYGSLLDMKLANQSGGVFYVRIEDTDKKREVENGVRDLLKEMREFGIIPDEGVISDVEQKGIYGPYKQSDREYIYKVCAKELMRKGKAYPCFCTSEELDNLRSVQEKNKIIPGYYGVYARCRNNPVEDMIKKVKDGTPYVVRFRSEGSHMNKVSFVDAIRGKIEMADNDQDIVIIKSDNLPTYHFAHAVDDHFMRTTLALRGEEWIPSTALHLQLFDALGFERVRYAHTPTMMKIDGTSKRKLSKRKDPESAVAFFLKEGYPTNALIEYILTIINSDFEPWRRQNPYAKIDEFRIRLEKVNAAGALFDLIKINDISKDIIGRMTTDEIFNNIKKWADKFDKTVLDRINNNPEYFKNILSIERENTVKVRKDFVKYSDVMPNIFYFFNDLYDLDISKSGYNFDEKIPMNVIKNIVIKYSEILDINCDKETWFNNLKSFADNNGFCSNMKEYKQNKEKYIGSIADIAGIIRVAVTNRQNTPDIYSIMNVLGKNTVIERLKRI